LNITLLIIKGDLVQEVRQIFNPWLSQTIRLFNGSSHIEVEITVDPMPINDSLGKELITRFSTDINNVNTWYTDANGMVTSSTVLLLISIGISTT
jgi:lysosomal alpha-mannosidase